MFTELLMFLYNLDPLTKFRTLNLCYQQARSMRSLLVPTMCYHKLEMLPFKV